MLRRVLAALLFGLAGFGGGTSAAAQPAPVGAAIPQPAAPLTPQGQVFVSEVEPNNVYTQATNLASTSLVVLGNIFPEDDADFFAFQANAGDRVYAAVMTSFAAGGLTNSALDLYNTNGVSLLESDDNDGTFGGDSSSIAGAVLPASGTYYLRVRESGDNFSIRPYHLHVRIQFGSLAAEVEPNNTIGSPQFLTGARWISGSVSLSTDDDFYALSLNAGDTLFASLDLNPNRAEDEWSDGRLGVAAFGGQILVVNDAGSSPPSSEATFVTVKDAGTYFVFVDSSGAGSGPYHLSVSVHLAGDDGDCSTYTSTDVPQTIPSSPGNIFSSLFIPEHVVIADLDVSLHLTHTRMSDVDALLISPLANINGLFTDVGSSTPGQDITLNLRLDDEAATRAGLYTVLDGQVLQPESAYRLHWFDGEDAFGEWNLLLYDDSPGEGGRLLEWGLTVCEAPPPPECPPGTFETVVFFSDFESGPGGFSHSGPQDEWEWGTPAFAPITTCYSGASCWATDLNNTYNLNSFQDLFWPPISLASYTHAAWLTWAQKFQLETATFDHAYVDVQDGNGGSLRVWEWLDDTMRTDVFTPTISVQESAGWGLHTADLTGLLGQEIDLRFHLDSDSTIQLAGLAIDDVTVWACDTYPLYLPLISD